MTRPNLKLNLKLTPISTVYEIKLTSDTLFLIFRRDEWRLNQGKSSLCHQIGRMPFVESAELNDGGHPSLFVTLTGMTSKSTQKEVLAKVERWITTQYKRKNPYAAAPIQSPRR